MEVEGEEAPSPSPSSPLPPGVGIFWDLKSCPIPEGVNADQIVDNIFSALDVHLPEDWCILKFIAYGNRRDFPAPLLEKWEDDGMEVHDAGGEYRVYRQLLLDLLGLSLDNMYMDVAYIVLISGDRRHQELSWQIHNSRWCQWFLVLPSSDDVRHLSEGLFFDWSSFALGSAKIIPKDEG